MTKLALILLSLAVLLLCGFRWGISPNTVKNNQRMVDFKNIRLPTTPNFYIMCPASYCPKSAHAVVSPEFNVSVAALQVRWNNMIKKQARTTLLTSEDTNLQRLYVQLTALWHFPDFIDVRFISLDENRATLAIYSHSYFGHSDFGVNKKRVVQWIEELRPEVDVLSK